MQIKWLWGGVRRAGLALRAAFEHRITDRVRSVALPLTIILGMLLFGSIVNRHHPITEWLFWRYAKSWLLALYWLAGCLSAGHALVRRLGPRLPLTEHWLLACATGVYASYVIIFLAGVLHLYRFGATAVLIPAVMLAAGLRSSVRQLRRAWRHLECARRLRPAVLSPLSTLIFLFGVFCLGLMYLGILDPSNASFDAIYYHLGIPQQYDALGGISASPEGWIVEALPQLAAIIYTWAFTFPGNDLFASMMLSAHIEFVLFVATLAGIPVVVRWLVPRTRCWPAWVAMFLFPAILVYDAGLHSANDHIAAFWAIPIWVALRRSWQRLEPGLMALFSVSAAGAVMTKYQAACLILVPTLALLGRGVWLGFKRAPVPWAKGLAVALGVGLVVTAPHWLKNWVWYGDPLFPALHRHLDVHPWHPHATEAVEWNVQKQMLRPRGTPWEKIRKIWVGSFRFPFDTRERRDFHGDWPIFGPLFALSLLWLPFLRRTKRIWALFIATQCGLFFWFFFSAFERYTQYLIPWMAAVVAAGIVLIWRRGWVARGALVGMVGLELVWGGDVYFFPHLMLKDSPIAATADFISAGFRGDKDRRTRFLGPYKAAGKEMPPGSKVLLHEHNPRLGFERAVVMDYPGFQTLISYQDLRSPEEVYDLYEKLGITHIAYQHGWSAWLDPLAGEFRFWEFVTNWAWKHKRYGWMVVAEMPAKRPDLRRQLPDRVVYLGCDPIYAPGVYAVSAMDVSWSQRRTVQPSRPLPKGKKKLAKLISGAGYVVLGPQCKNEALSVPPGALQNFNKAFQRGSEEIWIRRLPPPRAASKPARVKESHVRVD